MGQQLVASSLPGPPAHSVYVSEAFALIPTPTLSTHFDISSFPQYSLSFHFFLGRERSVRRGWKNRSQRSHSGLFLPLYPPNVGRVRLHSFDLKRDTWGVYRFKCTVNPLLPIGTFGKVSQMGQLNVVTDHLKRGCRIYLAAIICV